MFDQFFFEVYYPVLCAFTIALFCFCGLVAATIYHFKKGQFFTGLFAGLLLGPFGILLVMILPGRDKRLSLYENQIDWNVNHRR